MGRSKFEGPKIFVKKNLFGLFYLWKERRLEYYPKENHYVYFRRDDFLKNHNHEQKDPEGHQQSQRPSFWG